MTVLYLLFIVLAYSIDVNTQCSSATRVDLRNNVDFIDAEDTTGSPYSTFRIGNQEHRLPGRWYEVYTDGEGSRIEIDTCLSGQTNYDSRILVFSECINDKASRLISENDDSIPYCGTSARLIFNDKKKTHFYVFVTGSTDKDVGRFGLRIAKLEPHNNVECSASELVTIPSYQEGTTTAITPNLGDLAGLFYTVKGIGDVITVSTCHSGTNVDTIISVIDSCESRTVLTQNMQCENGNRGSYVKFNSVVGKNYIVHISSSPKKRGMFIAMFDNPNTVNPGTCEKAQAITTVPFVSTTKLDGSVQSMSCGNSLQKVGAWYSIVGDGFDYIFHTCNSPNNGPNDGTVIELFESCGSNAKCVVNDNGCGIHGKIQKKLEQQKNYFIKVSCKNPHAQCRATLTVDKINNQGYLNSCVFAKLITIEKEEDMFSDTFDLTSTRTVATKCGGHQQSKGVWYKVMNKLKRPFPLFVQSTVVYAQNTKHTAEIQMYRACNTECEEHQQSTLQISLKPQESIMFFVTANEEEGQVSVYARKDYRVPHDTCKTALEFNAPFSVVEYKSNLGKTTTPICSKEVVGRHTGIYYYFQSPVTDSFVVETCGIETQFDTYVEVFEGCGKQSKCVLSNDDSPECGSTASYVKFEAQQGAEYYIYVSEASKALDTEGTFRLNVYTLNPPEHSSCQHAELLTPGLMQHALTKYSYESVSTCKMNTRRDIQNLAFNDLSKRKIGSTHLRGLWYKYTATVKGKLHINTCDAGTSVRTRIGVYRACGIEGFTSKPDQCIIETSVTYRSCSTRGTYVSVDMEQGQTILIFIGGETSQDVGFIAVQSDFQTETLKRVQHQYKVRVGPRRIKERRSNWVMWGAIWIVYAVCCVGLYMFFKVFKSNDDFLSYHEL